MKRFLSLLLLACLSVANSPGAEPPPNILFILIDDMRWDITGVEGHPYVQTPNIDRIAREGVRFERAFVSNPVCSPSRATFLTGQYSSTHGIIDNQDRVDASMKLNTFAFPLQEAGYETYYLGKWHMGASNAPRPGWDKWVGGAGNRVRHDDPILNFDGVERQVPGYMTDILTDLVVDYILSPRDKPFLIHLSHKAVHSPYIPAERHKQQFQDQVIEENPSFLDDLRGKPMVTPNLNPELTDNMEGDTFHPQAKNQLRMLSSIDEGIGRILEALETAGELDQTVIVFTSDHGYQWGEHQRRGKRLPYEASIRVPLYIRYPVLIEGGSVRSQLVLATDFADTFTELAGAKPLKGTQGHSLAPLLSSEFVPAWRDSIYIEYLAEAHYTSVPAWQGLRTERWKLVRYFDEPDLLELYDLRADPFELTNLADHPSLQPTIRTLLAELDGYTEEANANTFVSFKEIKAK